MAGVGWSEEELAILKSNLDKPPRQLAGLFPGRSSVSVELKRRELGGKKLTRAIQLKDGWDVPSLEFAYCVGVIMSDGHITKYTLEFPQHKKNSEMTEAFVEKMRVLTGLDPSRGVVSVKGVEYDRVAFCSKEFARVFGPGAKGDWGNLIESKFPWVLEGDYFWYFLGGLYDGDGCLRMFGNGKGQRYYSVEIGILPERARWIVLKALSDRGFQFKEQKNAKRQVHKICYARKEMIPVFFRMLKSKISRKRIDSVAQSGGAPVL